MSLIKKDIERPHGIREEDVENIVRSAKDYAFFKGIGMRATDLSEDARVPLPFCLTPSYFPEKWFNHVKNIQKDVNLLIHRIANDPEFLRSCLLSTAEFDEFTEYLFNIYEIVLKEGIAQPLNLGILRSDYMLNTCNEEINGIKLIENNTFASSLGGMAPKLRCLHSYVLDKFGIEDFQSKLPHNSATEDIARGMISAWESYGQKDSAILFLVEKHSFNICDQRTLEFAIYAARKEIPVIRYNFDLLCKSATLKQQRLFVGNKEVGVVYFRYGFAPQHYSPEIWELRLLIERSRAIKCPSIAYHLAGTKKVQVHLSQPGVIEKFLDDPQTIERVRQVFVAHYALNMNKDGDEAVALALRNPQNFVLKPEREGGGNNLFDEELKSTLESIGTTDARQAYILMERINPPAVPNYIVQRDVMPNMTCVMSELGIFGVILGSKDEILLNYEAGHLLRSKRKGLNEGGLAAGFGAIDSPYLT